MNKRGFGSIYRRGSIYWIKYSYRGRIFRESSGSTEEPKATRLLKERIKQTGRPQFIGPTEERLTFEDLIAMLRTDYAVNGRRSASQLTSRITHLHDAFALVRVVDITGDRISAYVAERQRTGAASTTINRELAALKRAFTLALRAERLSHAPHIAMLEEHNARQGFLARGEFLTLMQQLPEYLRDPVTFLYVTGWRVSEMRSLEWRDVDLGAGVVRLRSENSKNKDSREFPFSRFPELAAILTRAQARRRLECRFVFHRAGRPVGDFNKSWTAACTRAGLDKTLVHDLRRTAVRNLVRAGVPERVAMELTGHKTRSVFERYNIVSPNDKDSAVQKLASYLDAQPTAPTIVPLTTGEKTG